WRDLAESRDYPHGAEHEDDYLASNARLVMWRVAERLVSEDAFAPLSLASPFMVGYSVHDEEEAILRLLNWPRNVQGAEEPGMGNPGSQILTIDNPKASMSGFEKTTVKC